MQCVSCYNQFIINKYELIIFEIKMSRGGSSLMDLYELMAKIIPEDQPRLSASFFADNLCNELGDDSEKLIFALLKSISSVRSRYEKDKVIYSPAFESADGRHSFSIQDLSVSDFDILCRLELERLPHILSLRIADILWTEKRDYSKALYAIKISHDLYITFFDKENWLECFSFIEHAIGLAARIKSKDYSIYLQEIYEKIVEINGSDLGFLSLSLIELLVEQEWTLYEPLLHILDDIIINSKNNIRKMEVAYELKAKIYHKKKDSASAYESDKRLAKYFECMAAVEKSNGVSGLFKAEKYLEKAIHLYRNNGAPDEGERVQMQLTSVQKEIPKYLIPLTSHVDVTEMKEQIESLFIGKSFAEQIVNLTRVTPLLKKEELKQTVLTNAMDPISALFGSGIKSSQGQTIVKIKPIDITNPEADTFVLEQHMHHEALLREKITGNTALKWALNIICQSNNITESSLKFLVEGNPIIPQGRERIFLSGLYHGLIGNLYLSLHILAPQVENLFRRIAENAGAVVTTLKDDDTSDAKLLSSVFELPELKDCYDNDILFMFQGLMNEKIGTNIRNEIAHGLMGEQKGNGDSSRFFFCWVLKLIALTSPNYHKMLAEMEKEL